MLENRYDAICSSELFNLAMKLQQLRFLELIKNQDELRACRLQWHVARGRFAAHAVLHDVYQTFKNRTL